MIVAEYFEDEGTRMVRLYSDSGRLIVDANGIQRREIIEPADPALRYIEGEYITDSGEAKDILDILLGEDSK